MFLYMQRSLVSISICILSFLVLPLHGQSLFPDSIGSRVRYDATIEMQKGYASGICVLVHDVSGVKGCLFNEFGISVISFTYFPDLDKVKIDSVIKMFDKWYIKRVLRTDLLCLMKNLQHGVSCYRNEKYKIDYKFSLLKDAAEE